ncbi:MAG TPA: glucodextranase DOMON-like domain-containing protein, partial [Gaiellaceae bacterium]
ADPDIVFRVRTRNLSPTFGSPIGAQMLDVYIHDPAGGATSTAAAFPQRNYVMTAAGAWNKRLEVQGFGQQFVDAGGTTLGTITIGGNAISRFITFRVPKAALGTPASGWAFTVVLTGQDGFSPDQARGFQATPQDFQFGVCAPGGTDPLCGFSPNLVPKALDVIPPSSISQATELNPLLGPVVLHGVAIP